MQAGMLLFSANFDSGNLGHVESARETIEFTGAQTSKTQIQGWADRVVIIGDASRRPLLCSKPDYHVKCWTSPDAHGSVFENGNKTWFHFAVRNYTPGSLIRISIMNVGRQSKTFGQGYTPVFNVMKSLADNPRWMRITEDPIAETVDGQFAVTFAHRFTQQPDSVTYFAFSYPWTYLDTQMQLRRLENMYKLSMPLVKGVQLSAHPVTYSSSIYFHRELLCYSLCGRRVDLITISDNGNKLTELEDRFDPLLFPEQSVPRPHKFANKKVFLVTARVHPGETPGSHMFNGLLEFLLREKDERAIRLRQSYVFKLIPMLNPDGVAMGHHRTDSRGVNLNRFYLQPNFLLYPAVYAVKALATYHHLNYASDVSYPGSLPAWQHELFVDLAVRYRHLAESVEFSPHTGNPIRLPFVDTGKVTKPAAASEKENMNNVAPDANNRLNTLAEEKRIISSTSSRPMRPQKLQRDSRLRLFIPTDPETTNHAMEPEDAEASPCLDAQSDSAGCCGTSNKRPIFPVDPRWPSSASTYPQPILQIHTVRVPRRSAGSGRGKVCETSGSLSEAAKQTGSISTNLSKSSKTSKQAELETEAPPELEQGRQSPTVKVKKDPVNPSSCIENNTSTKCPKYTDFSDDENEADCQTRKLDRMYVNMVAMHLNQDGLDVETKEAFLAYCSGAHLTHPNLLDVSPEESGVRCYIDLHGHCTKRGCFCYGNRLRDDRQMVDNVLYARLVAANSAFFDFGACNFSVRNMYLRDKVNDTTKEGSGRVGIWKHTGITHCYTVEANYTSSRVLNILSATVADDRCATPPGTLWGPLRGDLVVPKHPANESLDVASFFTCPTDAAATEPFGASLSKLAKLTQYGGYVVSHEERYTLAHFHEMGRGLLTAALDMWSVNPWSRLATSSCADINRFRVGTYCNVKSLCSGAFRFGKPETVHCGTRLSAKVLRKWAKCFVGSTMAIEGAEAQKSKEAASSSPRTRCLISHVSAPVAPIADVAASAVSRSRREGGSHCGRNRLAASPLSTIVHSTVGDARPPTASTKRIKVKPMSNDDLWDTVSKLLEPGVDATEEFGLDGGSGSNSRHWLLPLSDSEEMAKQALGSPALNRRPEASNPADRQHVPIHRTKRHTKSVELVLSVKSKTNQLTAPVTTTCSMPVPRLSNPKHGAARVAVVKARKMLTQSNSNVLKSRSAKLARKRPSLVSSLGLADRLNASMAPTASTTAVPRLPPARVTTHTVPQATTAAAGHFLASSPSPGRRPLRLRHVKRLRRTRADVEHALPRVITRPALSLIASGR